MTNPPYTDRLWVSLSCLVCSQEVMVGQEHVWIRHPQGHWAIPFDEIDRMTELGWLKLDQEDRGGGETAEVIAVSEKGMYWLKRWAKQKLRWVEPPQIVVKAFPAELSSGPPPH